jgi:arginyl-tRNA synthetase
MVEEITKALIQASIEVGISSPSIKLEHPEDISHGDFSSNVAMVHAKVLKVNPSILAEKIVKEINKNLPDMLDGVSVALPGFINFKIKDSYFSKEIIEKSKNLEDFGRNKNDNGKKIIIDYTQPNPFKEFHIGHLMNNIIGESISRLLKNSGDQVKNVTYHGDVGIHIAKGIWGILNSKKEELTMEYLGKMYALGSSKYEDDEQVKKEIIEINKKVFDRSDSEINKIYDDGRKVSLEYFDYLYKRLDSDFNNHFYESDSGKIGKEFVLKYLDKGIFERGDKGAVVFKGENYVHECS